MKIISYAYTVGLLLPAMLSGGCQAPPTDSPPTATEPEEQPASQAPATPQVTPGTQLCSTAEVREDDTQNLHYMSVRGMTFPFRSAPCKEAARVWIKADDQDPAAALGSILLRRGARIVLADDARDGGKTQPALDEVALYLQQASTNAPERATLPADEAKRAQELERLKQSKATVVLAQGPAAGAKSTLVTVDDTTILLEGDSYESVVRAADRAVLELAAVFCGTKSCSDPVSCSQGRSCGCRKRSG